MNLKSINLALFAINACISLFFYLRNKESGYLIGFLGWCVATICQIQLLNID